MVNCREKVTILICTLDVPNLNLEQTSIVLTDVPHGFLSLSSKMLGQYLKLGHNYDKTAGQ
jgi:hypothetical protein